MLSASAVLAVAADQPVKSDTSSVAAWLRIVGSELRELRRELLEDRLERQQIRVRELERESEGIRAERQQAEESQRSQGQELAQVEQQLQSSSVPAEERAQLEAVRNQIASRDPAIVAAAMTKEQQVNEALGREHSRLESLRQLDRLLEQPLAVPSN